MRPLLQLQGHAIAGVPLNDHGGCFLIPCNGVTLRVIAAVGMGWDHVSLSLENRCPTWEEMEFIKRLFFLPTEWAMQLHAPPSQHISIHPYCLHLWRPQKQKLPIPPAILV